MGWIANRIKAEHRKYSKSKDLDWIKLAEAKIKATIKAEIEDARDSYEHLVTTNWTNDMAETLNKELKL